ncbi:MAG: glycosyltransferase family 39 protein [Elusimicrobiota bacterium]|jgi:hypothetical protein
MFSSNVLIGRTAVRPYILTLIVLGIGTFLRFHALDRQSLWDDEMSTLQTISTPRSELIHRFQTYEIHPPLYFFQMKLWQKAGARSLVNFRANSACWGTLSLLLIFLLGRRYGGPWAGLWASAYAAFSPYHLSYSQEIRPYALAIVIALAALLVLEQVVIGDVVAFLPYWRKKTIRQKGNYVPYVPYVSLWVILTILWTAQFFTHYWGAFVVSAQALYAWTRLLERPARMRLLRSVLIAGGLFCLWLPILLAQMEVVPALSFWVPRFSFASLLQTFGAFSGIYFNMASSTFYLPTVTGIFALLALAHGLALVHGLRRGPSALRYWLCVGLAIPCLISLWKPAIFLWYRYTFHLYPAFCLLLVLGALRWRPRALGILLLATCLGTQLWGSAIYFTRWQKANPKAVVSYIHWLRQPESIVVRPFYFARLFQFYDQGTLPVIDQHLLDSVEKRAALKGKKIILVAFNVPYDPVTDALLSEFKVVSAQNFPGLARLGITVYQLE